MENTRLVNEQKYLYENNNLLIKYNEELNSSIYQCSINQTYAITPYLCMCGCGSIFDKDSIVAWLMRSKTCPISRRNITMDNLVNDRTRKNKIDELLELIENIKEKIKINEKNILRYKTMITYNNDFISYNTKETSDELFYQITTNSNIAIKQTIYFLCDTSYSMNSKITIKNSEIDCVLSYLDLVKHSLGVFCKLLVNNKDVQICIVKFSSHSKVIFEPQYITTDNIDSITNKINTLVADGQTNIYSAFLKTFEYINKSDSYSNIVLLTDGIPTKEFTPNGLDKHVFKTVDKNNLYDKICIHTIGLGYNLEINSLLELSKKTNGSYFYMPESSLVGPTIIHLLIHLIKKCCKSVKVEFTFKDSTDILENLKTMNLFNYNKTDNKLTICLGSMEESQKLIIKLKKNNKPIDVKYIVTDINNNNSNISFNDTNEINILQESVRLNTIEQLQNIYEKLVYKYDYTNQDAKNECDTLISKLKSNNYTDFYLKDFLEDITDQIYKAFTNKSYFEKWGKFFIPSIIQFHHKKICPNFIQPGLQHYKTDKLADLAEDYHEIFCQYEPPTPSQNSNSATNQMYSINTNYNSALNNSALNTHSTQTIYRTISSAGCISGDCKIKLANNTYKKISELKKNDRIIDATNQESIIECVVVFPCDRTACLSVFQDGLKITPYHPVKINNTWKFPIDIVGAKNMPCDKVYNFVLNTRRSITVNNITCCTLGHNIRGPIIGHDFFGTDNVIDNLKTKFSQEYDYGLIDNITKITRSPNTNNIIEYDKM